MAKTNKSSKIVVIGGGTGAPVVIKSLLLGGFKDITVISVSMDSGGRTGIIRSDERDRVIAISDTFRCLLALINEKDNHKSQVEAFTDLVSFTDGRKRNLGYTLYYALLEKYQNDFFKVQTHFEHLLGIKFSGTVIPVTTESTNIYFSTLNGSTFVGEHELDRQEHTANTITSMWLEPKVKASPHAIKAITSATHIIYSPGSLYGSILANFLPVGMKDALKKAKAEKIFLTNLVSTRNQNHEFSIKEYIKVFKKYTGLLRPFDTLITPDISRTQFENKYKQESQRYALEHSYFIGYSDEELADYRPIIRIITGPIAHITKDLHRIRHNPQILAKIFKQLIS